MLQFAAVAAAYLLGSIPFGFIVFKVGSGDDIRKYGSGNIGATNVLRTKGKLYGVLTLVPDLGKGMTAVMIPHLLNLDMLWVSLCGAAVVLGHMYPVFLLFRGGKGVATCAGVFLYLAPVPFLAAAVLFIAVVAVTRYVSLGSILSAAAMPLTVYIFIFFGFPYSYFLVFLAAFCAVFIIIRHSSNIGKLISGREGKLGEKNGGEGA